MERGSEKKRERERDSLQQAGNSSKLLIRVLLRDFWENLFPLSPFSNIRQNVVAVRQDTVCARLRVCVCVCVRTCSMRACGEWTKMEALSLGEDSRHS